jgi:WD40 repeat protein
MASGSNDSTIKLWDVQTGSELQTLTGHTAPVQSVALSSDGLTVASCSDDKTIKLWDVKTGSELQTPAGNSGSVRSVAHFSPTDRHHIPVSFGLDPQVSLSGNWISVAGENLIAIPPEYRQHSCSAAKGAKISLGYSDGRVLIIGFHFIIH